MIINNLLAVSARSAQSAFEAFVYSTSQKKAYGSLLRNTHAYVSLSVPTTRETAATLPVAPLYARLIHAADEEEGHELDIENDLSSFGFSIEQFELSPSIADFCTIQRNNSKSEFALENLLGRMLVLEGMHPKPAHIDKLLERFDLPKTAATAFYLHAELDAEHGDEVLEMIADSSVSEERVLWSAIRTCQLFRRHWNWMADQWADQSEQVARS